MGSWFENNWEIGLIVILILWSSLATAQVESSCWGQQTALNASINLSKDMEEVPFLKMTTFDGVTTSVGKLILKRHQGTIEMAAQFNDGEPELGNPINIYSIMVFQNNRLLLFEDFTESCLYPGISFFPGQYSKLGTLKEVSNQSIQIIIWARR